MAPLPRRNQLDSVLGCAHALPYAAELGVAVNHDDKSVVGSGCENRFEFEFALDLLLDGFERLQQQGWTSTNHVPRGASA